jgi:zinc protease
VNPTTSTVRGGNYSVRHLSNGLRILVAPDETAPVASLAVTYGFGHRDEPYGLDGVAHLFEHLAFSGSPNHGPGEHFDLIQQAGGIATAYTGLDYTQYYQIVPADCIDVVLELESDRMRAFTFDEHQKRQQLKVIDSEVRSKIDGKSYGGFSWQYAHQAIFHKWENVHPGFVSNPHLLDLSVAELLDLRERYYHPANAVISIAGRARGDELTAMIESLFGDIAAGPPRQRPDLSEKWSTGSGMITLRHGLIRAPAVATVFRAPDIISDFEAYYHLYLLGALLCLGRGAPLFDALVGTGRAVRVRSQLGVGGDPAETGDPNSFTVEAFLGRTSADALSCIEAAVSEALDRAGDGLIEPGLLAATVSRVRAGYLTRLDDSLNRARMLGWRGLASPGAGTLADVDRVLASTTIADLARQARFLSAQPRRVLHMLPQEAS